jgi:UDPglucose 6-dehydrogenase
LRFESLLGELTVGLAFKAGTDDVRSSPAFRLARWLLAREAVVHAFDPSAASQALRELPGLIIRGSALDALTGADVAVIATEWPEFRDLDWERARSLMAVPLVLDGRRLLDSARMAALGFHYERVGSPAVGRPGGESPSS